MAAFTTLAAWVTEPLGRMALAAGAAAVLTGLGALPFSSHHQKRPRLVGLADALAAGVMLGAGYLLMRGALQSWNFGAIGGAALGVLYTTWVQRRALSAQASQNLEGETGSDQAAIASGASELPGASDASEPKVDRHVVLRQALHSSSEGVAIGVAAAFDLRLGAFVLAALALHNIAEGVALSSVLHRRGHSRLRAAWLCVAAKSAQPVLAVTVFALFSSPSSSVELAALGLGFGAGALVFLVLTELLPESYRLTDHRAIATLVTVATGAVLFLEDFFR